MAIVRLFDPLHTKLLGLWITYRTVSAGDGRNAPSYAAYVLALLLRFAWVNGTLIKDVRILENIDQIKNATSSYLLLVVMPLLLVTTINALKNIANK